MATTVESLITRLRGIVGDEDSSNQRYTDANLRDVKFQLAIEHLDAIGWPKVYKITGSGSAKEFDPDPATQTLVDLNAIVIATALVIAEGEAHKHANAAIVISNPAGRTDLSSVARTVADRAQYLSDQLEALRNQRARALAETEMTVREIPGSADTESPEGLPIITITREHP